jgi:hypothetical protein
MFAILLPLLDKLLGSIITPIANAWVSYQSSKEAGFAAGAAADASIAIARAQSEVQNNALKVQLYGTPIYRLITCIAGLPPALHFGAVFIDTILASGSLCGHPVIGVQKLPPPYDMFEWAIVSSFFLVHAINVGTSNVTAWLGPKK